MEGLRFTPALLSKPVPTGLAVETTLHHFAIVSYWVDADALRRHMHPRFQPDCVSTGEHAARALVSVVTFQDRDFRFVSCPWPRGSFGQTNYRAYAIDRETGEHVAWFFGTCLDSLSVAIPRHLWKLPWHRARIAFNCAHDNRAARYSSFAVTTESRWAPAELELEDSGGPPQGLSGFSDLEAGMVLLTHPLRGYFFRRDGALGSYAIWHDRLQPTIGQVRIARYPLLHGLGLVEEGDDRNVHSVLIQRAVDFTIYLPPVRVAAHPEGARGPR